MKRREVKRLIAGAAAAWPLAARAEQARGMPMLGVLMAGLESAPDNQKRIAAFREAFADLGWQNGDNIRVEYRWSEGKEELIRQYAQELVKLGPSVILANSTPVITEFKRITPTIPVVFALAMDPVGLGHVASLSHPGGNFTGFTFIDPELIGKWMGLLKSAAPSVTGAAVLFNPQTTPNYLNWVREMQAAPTPGALEIVAMPVGSADEAQTSINTLARSPGKSLIIGPDPFNQVIIKQIAQLAQQNRLPAISVYRPFALEGGLMSYGPDTADVFRRAAAYVDRILKGTKPADLPVQQPTKFEFIVNLKTANALGINLPPTLLALADEVIE